MVAGRRLQPAARPVGRCRLTRHRQRVPGGSHGNAISATRRPCPAGRREARKTGAYADVDARRRRGTRSSRHRPARRAVDRISRGASDRSSPAARTPPRAAGARSRRCPDLQGGATLLRPSAALDATLHAPRRPSPSDRDWLVARRPDPLRRRLPRAAFSVTVNAVLWPRRRRSGARGDGLAPAEIGHPSDHGEDQHARQEHPRSRPGPLRHDEDHSRGSARTRSVA
jgi:hypothetical protein